MQVRKFTKDDLLRWGELAKTEFCEEDFCGTEYFEKWWEDVQGWVLETEKGEWIGVHFNSNKRHDFNPGKEQVHFLQTVVFPKYRGLGYGRKLIEIGLENSIGKTRSACINPENLASIKLYESCGFVRGKPHKTWDVYLCE